MKVKIIVLFGLSFLLSLGCEKNELDPFYNVVGSFTLESKGELYYYEINELGYVVFQTESSGNKYQFIYSREAGIYLGKIWIENNTPKVGDNLPSVNCKIDDVGNIIQTNEKYADKEYINYYNYNSSDILLRRIEEYTDFTLNYKKTTYSDYKWENNRLISQIDSVFTNQDSQIHEPNIRFWDYKYIDNKIYQLTVHVTDNEGNYQEKYSYDQLGQLCLIEKHFNDRTTKDSIVYDSIGRIKECITNRFIDGLWGYENGYVKEAIFRYNDDLFVEPLISITDIPNHLLKIPSNNIYKSLSSEVLNYTY